MSTATDRHAPLSQYVGHVLYHAYMYKAFVVLCYFVMFVSEIATCDDCFLVLRLSVTHVFPMPFLHKVTDKVKHNKEKQNTMTLLRTVEGDGIAVSAQLMLVKNTLLVCSGPKVIQLEPKD